jgi:hypothetical protein
MGEPAPPPPLPQSASQPTIATQRFTVLVAVAAAIVIAATFIGYSEWKSSQPSMAGLPIRVRESMNQSLSTDEQFRDFGLQVTSITVMRSVGNLFEGQATVSTHQGTDHPVNVHINYDGDTLLWSTDPGAFLFAAREQLQGN